METQSSVLAWRIPGTGEPGGLLPMGSYRVGHDWSNLAAAAALLINNNGSLSLSVHLTSLSITSYWSIYVGENGKNEIHFKDWVIFHLCVCVCVTSFLSIHLLMDTSCLHTSAAVNNDALNIGERQDRRRGLRGTND